jgi:hypothetical protein
MQREILGLQYGDPREGDHALHNTLDNRLFVDGKENLRIATRAEQNYNKRKTDRNTSGFKGVSLCKSTGRWRACINIYGKRKHLGYFDTKEESYAAYCKAAIELHGKFANFG